MILIVNVRSKLLLLQNNFIWKEQDLKRPWKIFFQESQTAWSNFLKPAVKVAAPCIGKAVSAKIKSPEVGQATTGFLKIISGGKILSLTDMHEIGLRLKVL